jgi:shikimate kinase
MTLMESYGDVVYLKVSDNTLVNRLKLATGDRPIVKGKTTEELRQYVTALREKCEHHYLRAKYIVDGDSLDMESVIKSLAGLSER